MRKKKVNRILAFLLCINMIFVSYFGNGGMQAIFAFAAQNIVSADNGGSVEAAVSKRDEQSGTNEALKERLMHQIKYEGWDPYSSDMSLEEFYALMELFQDGALPLGSESPVYGPFLSSSFNIRAIAAPGTDEPGTDEPGTDAPADEAVYVPSRLFLMSGLGDYEGDDAPTPYDNDTGKGEHYPPGLDTYGTGYYIPPTTWKGVPATQTNNTEAFVIVPGINDSDRTVAGDVDQKLFPKYEGYYVRRVTAQDSEVNILGAIKLFDNKLVYYYLTDDTQSTEVSTTMLSEGQKFVIQYNVSEHHMFYEVRMNDPVSGEDVTAQYADDLFGADRPTGTTDGYYSFVATAPYGYEMQIFRLVDGENEPEEITGKERT